MSRYTILSGSSRKNSSSLRVSKGIQRVLEDQGAEKVDIIDFEHYDITFFNGDPILKDRLTGFQERLIDSMEAANSIIMVTPEYNWFPSAELVNLIHRLGSPEFKGIWDEKVISFVGVSTGRGGRMPTVQLGYVIDKIINVFGFDSVTNPKTFEVQFAKSVLDDEGGSTGNEEFDKGFNGFIKYLIRLSNKWQKA